MTPKPLFLLYFQQALRPLQDWLLCYSRACPGLT